MTQRHYHRPWQIWR